MNNAIAADNFVRDHPYKSVKIGNKAFTYLTGGTGNTTFLIFPGSGQDALSCFDLISAFEKHYKVIAVNYDGLYSVDSFFDYIEKILHQEQSGKLIIYGLSMGGFLVQHYVRRYPSGVERIIISHAGSTRSKTIKRRVALPATILYPLTVIIPQKVLSWIFRKLMARAQAGSHDPAQLYRQFSSVEDFNMRVAVAKRSSFSMANKRYLKSLYRLGRDVEKMEELFDHADLQNWNGKILILRTDNDPLAQDDGLFAEYYPDAKVVTFHETGHLTSFIRSREMIRVIKEWLEI